MTLRDLRMYVSTDNHATFWIKEIDFTGCIMDCEVHFK